MVNSAYQELERFYDVVVLPPPARKPKGKPTVEKGVQWLETHLLEELKERIFCSVEELNREVRRIVNEQNSRKKTGKSYSRQEAFVSFGKPKMQPLSNGSFSPCKYRHFGKVPSNSTCTTMSITIPCPTPCMAGLLS